MKTLILITAIYHGVLSALVPEAFENYSCGEGSHGINTEHANTTLNCEQIWTIGDIPIATFWNGVEECQDPCSEVTPGGITITDCSNITLTIICFQGYLSEYRIHFHGIINSIPPNDEKKRTHIGALAGFGALLLLVLGLTIHYCKSHLK